MIKKEQVLKFYTNYRQYIFSAVVVLSSLILIIFVLYPQTSKLLSNRKVEEDVYKKSKFLEAKVLALESYDPQDLNLKIRNVLSSYPAERDLVSAVSLLQTLSVESGFNIIFLSLGQGLGKGSTQSYVIKLDILGPKTLLPIILSNIENSPRLMRVSSLETTVGKDPAATTISLQIEVLYSSDPVGVGSVDSPLPELSQKDEEVLARLATVSPAALQPQIPTQLPPRGKANPFE